MSVKYNISVDAKNTGVRIVVLPVSSPVIKDQDGNTIKYKIIADLKGLDYSIVAVNFEKPGTYTIEKGTPVEDNTIASIIDADTIASNTAIGSGSVKSVDAFYPVFEKRIPYDSTKPSNGHLQGIAIDDNGNIWISVQSDLYLIDSKTWDVIDHIGVSQWFHDGQNHFGDIDYYNGYIYGLAENWQGSGQDHSPIELWKIDPITHSLVEKIPCSADIKEAASVHVKDDNTIYIADYDNAKIYVVDSSCNLIKTIDVSTHITYIQGVTILDNGMLAVTGDNDTGPIYCVCDEALQTVNILENYSDMVVEGIDAKDGVVVSVLQKCITCDTFVKVYAQGKTLVLANTNGTSSGGNLIAPVGTIDSKTYVLFAETEGKQGATNTNKSPAIVAYTDASNLVGIEYSETVTGPVTVSNGTADTSKEIVYDSLPESMSEFRSDSNASNTYIVEGGLALINNNGTLKFYIQDINNIYMFNDSESLGNNNNIGVRNWRLTTFTSPLVVLDYTGDPPDITLNVTRIETHPLSTGTGLHGSKIILAILGLLGLLVLLGRKKR